MALETALPEAHDVAGPSAAVGVREILRLMVKAQKALRLYQAGNAISERLQAELFTQLSTHLDECGPLTLTVREFRILLGKETVYEGTDRNDSLAFLLFRDGIRQLSFRPGLTMDELHKFLTCLNRVAVLANEQDDLVTLFWDEDFKAIKYVAIDELAGQMGGVNLEAQLASGSLERREGEGGAPADAVSLAASLKELAQPVSHLPLEVCQLEEGEIEALHAELAAEERDPFCLAAVELAIELALLEEEEEQEILAESLASIVNQLLMEGELSAVTQALEHMSGLTKMAFSGSAPVRRLNESLVQSLAQPEHLARFLEQVEEFRSLKPPELTAYLVHLGPDALPTLVPWMGRLKTRTHRRAVTEAVLAHGTQALEILSRHLPPHQRVSEADFLHEALFALTHLPHQQTLPLVAHLLQAPERQTRRATAAALGWFDSRRVDDLSLEILGDEDSEVRAIALDTLVRRGNRELARLILDRSIGAADFSQRSLQEKRRIFAAVAKLGGVDAIPWFAESFHQEGRRWFSSRAEREVREAAAHGIRVVGTEEARQLLRNLAEKGDRWARAACLKELTAERRA